MEDIPIHKIQISGAALASILHRSFSSIGDIHGYLMGITSISTPNSLSDHSTPIETTPLLITTITSFLSLPSHLTLPLPLPLPLPQSPPNSTLLGYFSARRKTPLRPSLKDTTTLASLALTPSVFLLLTTPFQDQLIHTHEYKAFQFVEGNVFQPKGLDVVNIGPSFRSQYESFSPIVTVLPMMGCEEKVKVKEKEKEQEQLDAVADGFEIGRLRKLMGTEYTGELEGLYDKMLDRIDGLAKLVEHSNARVMEQEKLNMILRRRVAGLE